MKNENNKEDEGWIALSVAILVVVVILLIAFTPDAETIGSWVYALIH